MTPPEQRIRVRHPERTRANAARHRASSSGSLGGARPQRAGRHHGRARTGRHGRHLGSRASDPRTPAGARSRHSHRYDGRGQQAQKSVDLHARSSAISKRSRPTPGPDPHSLREQRQQRAQGTPRCDRAEARNQSSAARAWRRLPRLLGEDESAPACTRAGNVPERQRAHRPRRGLAPVLRFHRRAGGSDRSDRKSCECSGCRAGAGRNGKGDLCVSRHDLRAQRCVRPGRGRGSFAADLSQSAARGHRRQGQHRAIASARAAARPDVVHRGGRVAGCRAARRSARVRAHLRTAFLLRRFADGAARGHGIRCRADHDARRQHRRGGAARRQWPADRSGGCGGAVCVVASYDRASR